MSTHPRGHRSHASGKRWMQRDSGRKKERLVQHAESMEAKMVKSALHYGPQGQCIHGMHNGCLVCHVKPAREAECEECGGSGKHNCSMGSCWAKTDDCHECGGTGRKEPVNAER